MTTLKRYLLFADLNYYPEGGWSDFRGSFASIDEAKAHNVSLQPAMWQLSPSGSWAEIVDLETGEILEKYDDRDTRKPRWRAYDDEDMYMLKNHRGEDKNGE